MAEATKYRLLGFPTSPFVRKVRVHAEEAGLCSKVEFETIVTTPLKPNAELCESNPLGKIPALVMPTGEALYDSRVICDYFDTALAAEDRRLVPAAGSGRFLALRRQALGDGIMDAMVMLRYECHMRPQECGHWPEMVEAQKGKANRALDSMEKEAQAGIAQVDVGTISYGCALGFLDLRFPEMKWRDGRPHLAAWFANFSERESMKKTFVDPASAPNPLAISKSGKFASNSNTAAEDGTSKVNTSGSGGEAKRARIST